MQVLLLGIWDIPVSEYWIFYLLLGLAGAIGAFIHRYLLGIFFLALLYFVVQDFRDFYRYSVHPSDWYIFQFMVGILLSAALAVFGVFVRTKFSATFKRSLQ